MLIFQLQISSTTVYVLLEIWKKHVSIWKNMINPRRYQQNFCSLNEIFVSGNWNFLKNCLLIIHEISFWMVLFKGKSTIKFMHLKYGWRFFLNKFSCKVVLWLSDKNLLISFKVKIIFKFFLEILNYLGINVYQKRIAHFHTDYWLSDSYKMSESSLK